MEVADLKHLQANQDEMIKKLAILDDDQQTFLTESNDHQLKPPKKLDYMSKKIGWRKGWTWKQRPIKSSSIEEEPAGILK